MLCPPVTWNFRENNKCNCINVIQQLKSPWNIYVYIYIYIYIGIQYIFRIYWFLSPQSCQNGGPWIELLSLLSSRTEPTQSNTVVAEQYESSFSSSIIGMKASIGTWRVWDTKHSSKWFELSQLVFQHYHRGR